MDELSEDTSIIRNGEENDETYIEKMKDYFTLDFEVKELTAEKQTEYITYVADYEPVLFIRMAQWMQFFADNPSIELVAHITTSAYKSHDAFYRCNMNEVANANGNKRFFMPLESQGTNTKMILGITALAVGLGLWKGKEIMSISEKITESIKNMKK